MSMGHLYVFLGEVSVQVLCPLFNWICLSSWCYNMSSLYILEIKPLSNVSLVNMFSHRAGSLPLLMMVSLAVQKLFDLMQSHLFIFSFISLALGDILAKILLHGVSEILLAMFFL